MDNWKVVTKTSVLKDEYTKQEAMEVLERYKRRGMEAYATNGKEKLTTD